MWCVYERAYVRICVSVAHRLWLYSCVRTQRCLRGNSKIVLIQFTRRVAECCTCAAGVSAAACCTCNQSFISQTRLINTMSSKTTLCICGAGNGAHVMTGLAAAHASVPEVRVLTLFQDEAERWTGKLEEEDLTIVKHHPDGNVEEIKAKPTRVTTDASKAVPGANIIIFCVPAFAHQQYFEAIAPYIAKDTSIIGLPGQPGFEFQCFHILKEKAKGRVILNYETLPWACRISEFGRKVNLLGTKDTVIGSRVSAGSSQPSEDPVRFLQSLLGSHPVIGEANSYLEIILMTKAFAHPPLMYGRWGDWDGVPLSEKPLFYQGLSEYAASLLSTVSQEIVTTACAISEAKQEVKLDNVEHLEPWFIRNYRRTVQDPTSLYTAMKTNSAYNGGNDKRIGMTVCFTECSWFMDIKKDCTMESVLMDVH
ncbi:opine dehydrogenase-like isoform X2 [Babylonia areolata]|uniref:opine dehydrogenase-like isoform X2 n=1 Tax=Babylonia areolata TaxID=304850 RepID=UPI003FD6B6BC